MRYTELEYENAKRGMATDRIINLVVHDMEEYERYCNQEKDFLDIRTEQFKNGRIRSFKEMYGYEVIIHNGSKEYEPHIEIKREMY